MLISTHKRRHQSINRYADNIISCHTPILVSFFLSISIQIIFFLFFDIFFISIGTLYYFLFPKMHYWLGYFTETSKFNISAWILINFLKYLCLENIQSINNCLWWVWNKSKCIRSTFQYHRLVVGSIELDFMLHFYLFAANITIRFT